MFTNSFLMGGMEEHVLQLAEGLGQRGFRVAVICSPAQAIRPLRVALVAAGVSVHTLRERGCGPVAAALRLVALIGTLRAYPGCVLHLHLTGHRGGDLVAVAGRLAGVRAVLRTMHLPPLRDPGISGWVTLRLRDLLLDEIVCVSEQNRRAHVDLLGRDPRKCRLIHHGVDLGRFRPRPASQEMRTDLGIAPGDAVVGTVSRLGERRKGVADFLAMAAAVATLRPDVRFLVVGDGELRPELERYAHELGIADQVIFAGERSDVPGFLASMQVFVMPSHYEAGPYSLLEAMAMGRPVVSTLTGLATEVIEDGQNGFLVPIGDIRALSRAVLTLLADGDLARRVGERGRRQVECHHSVAAMVEATLDAYRGIG
jgi:glycosyltransferase involved in cell wall biosynthesis